MRYFIFAVRIVLFPLDVFFTLACLIIHLIAAFDVYVSKYTPPLYVIILSLLILHLPSFIIQILNRRNIQIIWIL